jgi:hypothetical protein
LGVADGLCNATVSKGLLDEPQVAGEPQQPGGQRVAEGMRCDVLVDAGLGKPHPQAAAKVPCRQSFAVGADKESGRALGQRLGVVVS